VGVAYFGWLDTDLVRTGNAHKGFKYVREHLPTPLRSVAPADIATAALVEGVLRRKARVLAPGWLRLALAMRWFVAGNGSAFKAHMPEIERLCAEELKARGGSASSAMITDPSNQDVRG
jgi:hypothetical protein